MVLATPGRFARRLSVIALLSCFAARADAVTYTTSLRISSIQEVPSNGSAATGFGSVTVNTVANTLSFNITHSGLSGPETAAHIHGPAAPGVNAGVLFGLPAGSPKIGVWNYTEPQEASILAGLTYVNIHSSLFPGGEIRGQIPRGDCSGPVTRAQAAEIVKGTLILTRPDHDGMEAFGPISQIAAGVTIYDGTSSNPLVTVPANSWYFWIDDAADQLFSHPVRHVLVNASTGCVTHVLNGHLWPLISGVLYYRGYNGRLVSPERIWPAGEPPAPNDESGVAPSWPEAFAPRSPGDATQAAQSKWAILIAADDTSGANGDVRQARDIARVRRALSNKNPNGPMVPDANFTVAAGMDLDKFCQLIQNAPKNCDKMYIYWIGHGEEKPPGGVYFKDGTTITPEKWIQKVDSLEAKEYCIFNGACFSGRFVKAFIDSGLSGSISTGADSTKCALAYRDGLGKGEGSVYGHALAWCLEQGKTGAQLDQCIRDSVAKYVANLNSKRPSSTRTYPNPQFVETRTFTGPGGMTFNAADSCKTVCIQFTGDPAGRVCANATLYCLTNIHPVYFVPTWVCVRAWNWNAGQTRYFDTSQDPNSLAQYFLTVHSNGYPVRVIISWLRDPVPSTPSSIANFPAWSLGLQNATVEFGPSPPTATVNLADNIYLLDVPAQLGNVGTQSLLIREPLQGDPGRPFMHQNSDPTQFFNGPSTLVIGATNIQGPGGEPVTGLPVQVQVMIDGLPSGNANGLFVADPSAPTAIAGVTIPATATLPLPPLRPGLVEYSIQIPGFAGTATLDYFRLLFGGPPPASVPGELPTHAIRLEAYPNPGPGEATLRFELVRSGRARIRVYDVSGRLIHTLLDRTLEMGVHSRAWNGQTDDGARARAGLYYIRLETNGEHHSLRLALLR